MRLIQYICILVLAFVFFTTNVIAAGRVVVPAGRTIEAKLEQPIDCNLDRVGEPVSAILHKPFHDNGTYVLPAGSILKGKITRLIKPGPNGRNAELKIVFTVVETPDRKRIPIDAVIETPNRSGVLVGTKPSRFSSFTRGVVKIGKPVAIAGATNAVMNKVLPKEYKKTVNVVTTVGASYEIGREIKEGKKKEPAIKTAEQVVKYTPAASTYRLGKGAYKGIKAYEKSKKKPAGPTSGYNVELKSGAKLELLLLRSMTVSL